MPLLPCGGLVMAGCRPGLAVCVGERPPGKDGLIWCHRKATCRCNVCNSTAGRGDAIRVSAGNTTVYKPAWQLGNTLVGQAVVTRNWGIGQRSNQEALCEYVAYHPAGMIKGGQVAARSGMKRGSLRGDWITNEAFYLNENLVIMTKHLMRVAVIFAEHLADPNTCT